jgi:translation initiation factor 3 subunit A
MAAYYEKLTTLFWVSENYLFHAFAWYKFYTLCKEFNRGMTAEQRKFQASSVLLAALCIPSLPDKAATVQDDISKEKTARMATLLGFHTRNPTREALLSEIRTKNVMADVPDYLKDLYKLLEENNDPLVLVEKTKPLLERLRSEAEGERSLSAYVQPIVSVLLMKLMHALGASYHTISLDHVKSLTEGLGVTFTQVEKAIIACANSKSTTPLRVRIDHRANCLRFGDASGCAPFESDTMKSQLTNLARQLNKVCNVIKPIDMTTIAAERKAIYADVRASIDQEHEDMIIRKNLIESRKEESERLAQEKLKEQKRKKLEAMANAKAEGERRFQREQLLREKEKLEKIRKEMEAGEKKNLLKAMGQNVDSMTAAELDAMDADKLAKEHATKAARKKDNAERKVREVQKRLDYIVRATRIEEMPIIKKRYEENVKEEKAHYEADVIKKAKRAKLQWEDDCKSKGDLSGFGVFGAMQAFEKAAMEGRINQHKMLCDEEDRRAEDVAEKAKLQRARNRKDDEIRCQKEEEDRIQREAEEKKAEEERQKREEERRAKEAEQEEARRKKDAERQANYRSNDSSGPTNAPRSSALDNASGNRYLPPSRRGGEGAGAGGGRAWGNSGGGDPGSRNAWGGGSRGNSYGGGRYEGGGGSRGDDREGGGRYEGGGGSRGDNRDGGRYSRDSAPEPRSNSRWG